ncbi:MAG: hypothetical protein KGH56_02990 [Patescibacteria group bacterium]|nr:hypothetical protein [Patescibacteria group bacterium]
MWGRASSALQGSDRLASRRRKRRLRLVIACVLLLALLLWAAVYGLWQPFVRISSVGVVGADASLADVAKEDMQGAYFGIIPRDSILFFPASRIRADILAAHPDFAAISIPRTGLSSITIKIDNRVPIAEWCGLSPLETPAQARPGISDALSLTGRAPTPGVDAYCYVFDANGFVFAAAGTTTQTINTFTLYAPLEGATEEPLRATIAHASLLPTAFDFARQLATFGSPVSSIVMRGDEVDDYFESGTRLTYVLGHEQEAYTALTSARANLNISDGSLEYVDLRFAGNVYLKKK